MDTVRLSWKAIVPVVSVSNIGSSGQDRVKVRFPWLVSDCDLEWSSMVPDNPAIPGSSLTIGSRGIVAGSDTFLGSLTFTDVGGSLTCTPDYSPIGATSLLIEIYDAGVPVVSIPGMVAPSIAVAGSEFPRGCGKLNQWPLLCLWSEFQTSRQFTIDGSIVIIGDEIRVIAEGSAEVVAISEISLSTPGISSFAISSATATQFSFPHRPPPLDLDIDLATSHVILNWQSSIAYKDISVTVTDEDTQTAQVYSLPGTATSVDVGPLVTRGRLVTKFCLGQDTTVSPAEIFSVEHRLHGGLNHFSLGQAQLTAIPQGLQISNIGSSGEDGVSIALSDFAGLGISTICELPLMPIGSSARFRTRGDTTLGDIVLVRELDGVRFIPAGPPGVPVTYTLRAFLGDFTGYEATGVSGSTLVSLLMPGLQNIRYAPHWGGPSLVHTFHIEDGYVAAAFDPDPDSLHVFDRLEFTVDNNPPTLDPITHVEITASGLPSYILASEEQTPRPPILSVPTTSGGTIPHGSARVAGTLSGLGERRCVVSNIGSSGQDGVRLAFRPSADVSIELDPIAAAPGVIGSTLVVGSHGVVFGEGQFLGSVTMVDQGGSLSMTPDYSPISAISQRIEIYDQGVAVASFPGLAAPIIEVQGSVFPPRCGKLDQWPLLCLWFEWSSQRVFTVDGAVLAGDEIRVIAEGSVEVTALSELEFSTIGIPELSIIQMSSTPYIIPPITDLAASVDPVSGHVTLSWTNPIVYGSMELVMGYDVLFLGSPAPSQIDIGVPPPTPSHFYAYSKIDVGDTNVQVSTVTVIDLQSILPTGDPQFTRGDANNDSGIDIGDPIFVLAYLFSGSAAPSCLSAGDMNDDGAIDIGDPIYMLGFLFSGGPQPPAPFPVCGVDPTGVALACLNSVCPP